MWQQSMRADDEQIVFLCMELNREDPGTHPVPETHIRRTLDMLRNESNRGRSLVLRLDDKICGYALLITFWSNEIGGEVLYIDELYVSPSHRKKGHSTQLIQNLLGPCTVWPRAWVALELEVTPSNFKARTLYENLGFKAVRNSHLRIRLQH